MYQRAKVIAEAEYFARRQGLRIDPVDDRSAIGPVLGDRDPEVPTVVIETARVIDRAFAELQVGD